MNTQDKYEKIIVELGRALRSRNRCAKIVKDFGTTPNLIRLQVADELFKKWVDITSRQGAKSTPSE